MPDETDVGPAAVTRRELPPELESSLSAVWARYFGSRPSEVETEFDGRAVRWVLANGTEEFDQGVAARSDGDDDGEALSPARVLSRYKRDTSAAVAKATHRKVTAMISKHDKKTGVATETFILADPTPRN